MQKVLITGGGYLGSVIANLLVCNEYDVTIVDNYARPMSDFLFYLNRFPNFHFVKLDICHPNMREVLQDKDFIVHTAALSGEPICAKNPDLAWLVNYHATVDLMEIKHPDTKVIFHSSGSVYGKLDSICTEESPTNPLSVYAQTKLSAEEMLLGSYPNESICYRFSTAYGLSGLMRTNLLLNDLTYQAITAKSLTIYEPDVKRSFINTHDVATSILAGIENFDSMKGQVYNVGSKEGNWTKRQAAEYLKDKTGCLVTYAGEGYKDPDQRNYEISFDKIKPYWTATVSMEKGINELIKGLAILYEQSKFK